MKDAVLANEAEVTVPDRKDAVNALVANDALTALRTYDAVLALLAFNANEELILVSEKEEEREYEELTAFNIKLAVPATSALLDDMAYEELKTVPDRNDAVNALVAKELLNA